jgi:hypothetical protein
MRECRLFLNRRYKKRTPLPEVCRLGSSEKRTPLPGAGYLDS